jgi:hypothetical protein
MKTSLGYVIGGSLSEGLAIRINHDVNLEQITSGKFVVVAGDQHRFFCLITDIKLEVSNPDIVLMPPSPHEQLLFKTITNHYVHALATAKPMIMLDEQHHMSAVRTVPTHFCQVYAADEQDIALIFGKESQQFFAVGTPVNMHAPVCIDLAKFTERSSGVFGKTGTGKTFLTRVLLSGVIKNQQAVNLVFDMHSEYGLQARQERGASFVKGLKTLFPDQVAIFSLDPSSTRRRGCSPDVTIELSYQDIAVEDVMSLQEELNLHSTALEAAYLIAARYKNDWLTALLASGENLKDFAANLGAHAESIAALYRKLKRLEKLPFCTNQRSSNTVQQLLEYLDRGTHVILEFGNYTSSFCYLLVANVITRHIHEAYVAKTERFLGSQQAHDEPRKLMITVEEAHKFLNPLAARQTIFGTIAREMRKYYVSLLIVDQRPSGIDNEILSQIGTKIIAQLTDEKDLASILSGVANPAGLRSIIASLDSKQQTLIFGHAVPMPVVVQARTYDEQFYQAVTVSHAQKSREELIDELFS